MLRDEVWESVTRDRCLRLCEPCLQSRMQRVLGRPLRFLDLLPCPFNADYFEELAPPEMFSGLSEEYLDPELALIARWNRLGSCPRPGIPAHKLYRRRRLTETSGDQLLLPGLAASP
jgi:hypothetical protein